MVMRSPMKRRCMYVALFGAACVVAGLVKEAWPASPSGGEAAKSVSYCASNAEEPFEWTLNGSLQPDDDRKQLKSTPNTVHTFWLDVGVGSTDLLEFWVENWERHGWKTRVLGLGASMAHPKFAATCAVLESYPTINGKAYTMNNMLRWLGVAHVGGSWMADYDVAIFSPPPLSLPNGGALTVHQRATPAIVSGTSEEFGRVASLFATFYASTEGDEALREKVFEQKGRPHVSDQQLLVGLILREHIKFTRQVTGNLLLEDTLVGSNSSICQRAQKSDDSIVAFHFSHKIERELTIATAAANSSCVCGQPTESVIDSNFKLHQGDQRLRLVKTCATFWKSGCLQSHSDCLDQQGLNDRFLRGQETPLAAR